MYNDLTVINTILYSSLVGIIFLLFLDRHGRKSS